MVDCKLCFNCKATIPLKYPLWPPKGSQGKITLLHAQLVYNKAKIRCKQGHWDKPDGSEKIYEHLTRFTETVKISDKMQRCPDYEV